MKKKYISPYWKVFEINVRSVILQGSGSLDGDTEEVGVPEARRMYYDDPSDESQVDNQFYKTTDLWEKEW